MWTGTGHTAQVINNKNLFMYFISDLKTYLADPSGGAV
jgi:hypothetical protein